MISLIDLFPGFASKRIATSSGELFIRVGGRGQPLLLLHGYPQTHVMWHRVAADLAQHFTVVVADLPGYGASDVPKTNADHTPYTKRAMAAAMVELMEKLGYSHFALAGHDRGGRVAYRMALDHPQPLTKVIVLDILPTYDYWMEINRNSALKIFHWSFLAQPYPVPEQLLDGKTDTFFGPIFGEKFDPRAAEHYLAALRDPLRVHGLCEDYRAGAYADFEHDKVDIEGRKKISIPLHVIWGTKGIASATADPLRTWSKWATKVTGEPVDAGHFMCEESPDDTKAALLRFLSG